MIASGSGGSGHATTTLPPPERPCTRCDGHQELVGTHLGLGKYRCDTCGLAVGFDLEGWPVEFLLDRGVPGRYTKQQFGTTLSPEELRIEASGRSAS